MTEARDFSSPAGTEEPGRPKHVVFRTDTTYHDEEAVEDPPENYVMEHFADRVMRPRAMSHHLENTKIPSRKWLTAQAKFWRACMRLGMCFHDYPPPRSPSPSFVHKIQTDTIPIELYFYVPSEYHATFRDKPGYRYPVVVNFHGGGFCLGEATDDRYYARVILEHTSAIFVSVAYRRAPEHPFPIPVDDGVEALLYLATHAADYHIDPSKFALTGFSAGANLSLTIPFRLTFHTNRAHPRKYSSPESASPSVASSPAISRTNTREISTTPAITTTFADDSDEHGDEHSDSSSSDILGGKTAKSSAKPLLQQATMNAATSSNLTRSHTGTESVASAKSNSLRIPDLSRTHSSRPSLIQQQSQSRISHLITPTIQRIQTSTSTSNSSAPTSGYEALKILTIVAWYPLLDWTSSRSSKRRSAVNPAKTLNPMFTNLFDDSYLPPPDVEQNHISPYASPGLAPDEMLDKGLPERIQLWLCEYDMLLQEGKQFSERLERLGKDITTTMVEGVPHGWDKSPNPFRDQGKIDSLYIQAAERLELAFQEAKHKPGSVAGERIGLGGLV